MTHRAHTASSPAPQVGEQMATWFSDRPDGLSTVLGVTPYTGRYPEYFRFTVRLSAPRTKRGWLEMCVE